MTLTAIEVEKIKQAPTGEEVLTVVQGRWSPRSFSDRDVSAADLRKLFEAARWAPSCYNEQPWRFIVGRRNSDTYQKIGSSLAESNQIWALKAPVLILGTAKSYFTHNNAPNGFNIFDLGAATGFITLQAAELGLVTHQMGGFNKDAARKALGIAQEFDLGSVMALGYQGDPGALPHEQMLKQETSPRSRKALKEIVFSAWGEPAELT